MTSKAEIWTVRVSIDEVHATEEWEQEYDGDGEVCSYSYWDEYDATELCTVEVPYIGEEDEIRDEILIPALEEYLKVHILDSHQDIYLQGDCLSYIVFDGAEEKPILRLSLG